MIRRTKKEARPDLPDKIYKTIKVDMTKEQAKLYKSMKKDMVITDPDLVAPTVLAQITRLRQLALSPKCLLGELPDGAKTEAIVDVVLEALENGQKGECPNACRETAEAQHDEDKLKK